MTGALLPLPFGLVNLAGWCCYLTPKNFPTHVQNGCIAGAGELLLLLVLHDAKPVWEELS